MKSNFWKNAAMWLVAAGTLLGGVREAKAWSFSGGRLYFDANGLSSTANISLVIGKSSYSSVYAMTQIGSSKVFYVGLPSSGWGDASYMAIIVTSSAWGSGDWGDSNLSNATWYGKYTSGLDASSGNMYMFTKPNNNKGCTLSLMNYDGNAGPTSVNANQTVDWRDSSGGGASWSQNAWIWWYSQGFPWVNATNFGAHYVRIDNNYQTAQTLPANTTVKALTYTASATTAHTLSGNTLTVQGGITNASSTAHTISSAVALGANTTVNLTGGLTISGVISGSYTLTKSGNGTLTLSGANTYSGATTVSAGTLVFSSTTGLGTTAGGTTVASGKTLQYSPSSTGTTVAEPLTLNGGTLYGYNSATWSGTVALGANSTVQVYSGKTFTMSGVISGSYALTKSGAGTLTLSGANTYSGKTTISAGTVSINADTRLGTAPASATAGQITFSGSTACGLTATADFTLNANRGIALGSTKAMTLTVNNGKTMTYNGIMAGSGSGGFVKAGAGTLILGGASTYSGATTVSAGTLTLNGSLASSAVTLGAATLTAGSGAHAVKSLTMNNASSVLNVGTGNTFSGSGAASLTAGTLNFDASGWTKTGLTKSWTIFAGGAAATYSGVTFSVTPATGTEASEYTIAASGNNIVVTWTAPISEPTVTDSGASSVTATSATVGASVNAGGDSTTVSFGYSTTSGSYGTAGTVTGSPVTGTSATAVSTALSSLTPGATYYYRWSAYNSVNGSGSPVTATGSFTTLAAVPGAPTLASGSSSSITVAIATGSNVNTVQYAIKVVTGSTTKYVQADGSLGATAVWRTAAQWGATVTVTGLSAATTYTVSVAAKNSAGTATAYGTTANVTTASGVQKPTITEGTKTIGTTSATLPITVNMGGGATTANITLKYSTTSGSYTTSATVSPVTLAANVTAGAVSGSMSSLSAGTVYYYQWSVANSAGTTTATGSFATEPTAGTVTLTTPTASSLKVTGGRSNGYGMLIVMKKGSAPSWTPTDGNTYATPTGDRALTEGTLVATGEYIVYNGTAAAPAVTISGLDSQSQYYAKVYTYARVSSTASTYNYNTTSPGGANAYTLSTEPTWSSPSLTATVASTSQINLSWNAASGASGYVVVRKDGSSASTTKPSDGSSYSTGSGLGGTIVYVGSATSYNNTGLSADTTYSYTVWAYNGVSGTAATYNYLTTGSATATATTTASEPTQVSALSVTASSITTSGANFSWTKGNGTYTLVAGTAANTLTATPTDRTDYTASTTFSSGGQIATGVRTVYTNTASSVSGVTGLSADTLYTFAAYAFNGHSGTYNYNTASFPTVQFRTTANAPSAAPSISVSSKTDTTMTFSVTRATGAAGTVVIMYTAESMTGPSNPRTTYTASTTYGSGTRINNQGYVVYMGTDATKSLQVTGLTAGTTYYVRAYSFNGTSSSTATLCSVAYYTGDYGSANGTTFASQPTGAPTLAIGSTDRTTGSLTLTITKGANGANTLVQIYTSDSFTAPTDGGNYTPDNTGPTKGTRIGSKGYVIYAGSGTSVTMSGLAAGTLYYFKAYSYNGSGATANYYATGSATKSAYTVPNAPTLSATADGKTMVRLGATLPTSGGKTGMVLVHGGSTTPATVGSVPAVGADFAGGKVVWTGTANNSAIEHVVASGTTHGYRLFTYVGSAVFSAASSQSVSTGSFGADEIVDTFSYTNGVSLNGKNGEHGWSGAWDTGATTAPTIVSQSGSSIPVFPNYTAYPNNTGNRIKTSLGEVNWQTEAKRDFTAVSSGTIYAAAILSYQWEGAKKWAQIGLGNGSGVSIKAGHNWSDPANYHLGLDAYDHKEYSSSFEINPAQWSNDNDYLVILKYDFSTGKVSVKGYYHGSAVPETEPGTWDVTYTVPSGSRPASLSRFGLLAGATDGGAIGDVYFDEVRVATSWTKLLAREAVKPAAPTSFTVTRDGNEMIRGSVAAAESTILVVSNATSSFTAPTDGTTYNVGSAIGTGKVVYKGASKSDLEFVVPQGSTTYFAAYAYNGDKYSDAKASTPASIATGTHDAGIAVETFSYTNATTPSTAWAGGQGFSGNWSKDGDGTWYTYTTNSLDNAAHIGTVVSNYMEPMGNSLQWVPGDGNKTGTLKRSLPTSPTSYGGASGKTMYVSFLMAYQYYGAKKWAGLSLLNGTDEKAFFGKAYSPSYYKTLGVGAGSNTGWASKDLNPLDGGDGNHNNVYLVVGKVVWTAAGTANLYTKAYLATSTTDILPENEPTAWDAECLGASIGTINGVMFNAGCSDGNGGSIGCAYFDSLRIGTNWDAIIGSVAPTSIAMDSTTQINCYLGDSVQVGFHSSPVGIGQKAEFEVAYKASPAASDWTNKVSATWQRNEGTTSYWQSDPVQMTNRATGASGYPMVRTRASVTGGGTTVYTAGGTPNIYVLDLPNPTPGTLTGGQRQVALSWTKASASSPSRTWDTLVVRYAYGDSETKPTPGVTYNQGDTIGAGTVVYRGDGTSYTNTGLSYSETTYKYYFYAENWTYYSSGTWQTATTTAATETMPTINGNPNDWFGTPSTVYNSSVCSLNEFIWTDKPNDERTNDSDSPNAGLKEFRVKADKDYVYMLFKLKDITDVSKVHIGVGIDTRTNSTSSGLTWLGDDSGLGIGDGYFGENANVHYPERQLAIHYVNSTDKWQVEMFADDGTKWYAPVTIPNATTGAWKAAGTADSDCVEICINRADLKLNELTGSTVKKARFTVATFLNTANTWNNDGSGTRAMSDESNHAYDSASIMPAGVDKFDNDCTHSSWTEDLSDGDIDFWMDIPFNKDRMSGNTKPTTPAGCTPADDTYDHASPTLRWNASSDSDGEVTGYLLEVATDASFGATGGGSENGSVLYRVNLPPDTRSYKITTSGVDYWWRVRARDTSGELSGCTVQRYHVAGKLDNEGPKATLLYVGDRVDDYRYNRPDATIGGNYADHQNNYGLNTSVLDSECGAGHVFGFMIKWEDPSGVYATNKARKRVGTTAGDDTPWYGHNDAAYPGTVTKAGITYTMSAEGNFAYNIVSDQGRVSPNWDLIAVNTSVGESGPAPAALSIVDATGATVSKSWTWQTNNLEGMDYPGWTIEWGFDRPFQISETVADGNSAPSITNFVTSAFQLPKYDPDIEFYLTVSAEDACLYDEAGNDRGWEPWPPADSYGVTDNNPWTNPDKFGSWSDEYSDRTSSGFCADSPSKMRNVTTNQLIRIHVIDNDSTPPVFSNGKWGSQTVRPVDGSSDITVKPGLIVTTNDAAAGTWAVMANKLDISKDGGTSQDILYQIYDGDLYHNKLSFYFNVYDKFDESGLQYGNQEWTNRTKNSVSYRMTNSSFVASGWTTNWANFVETKSSITKDDEHHALGSKDDTVLAWQWPQVDSSIVTALWGPVDEALDTPYGVTNFIQLDAWDADMNRAGDQAHALVAFGSVRLIDDDRTAPTISDFSPTGSGTNMVLFGKLVQWTLTDNANTNAQLSTNVLGSALTGWKDVPGGTDTAETLTFPSSKYGAQLSGGMEKEVYAGTKYYQFDVWSTNGAYWRSQALTFTARTTAKGPTNFVVTVQQLGQHTVAKAPDADLADAATETEDWSYANGAHWNTAQNAHQLSLAAAGSSSQTALVSPDVNLTGTSSTDVKFKFSAKTFNASADQTLKLQYSTDAGTSWTDLTPSFTISHGADWSEKSYTVAAAAARVASVRFRLMCSTANTVGVLVKGATLTSGSNGTEEKYAEVSFEKDLNDEGEEKETKDVSIVAPFDEIVTGYSGETNRFKIYAFGAPDDGGNVNIKNLAVQGLVSAPRGREITDTDLRFGNWTNSLTAADGAVVSPDKVKSGLWLTEFTSTLGGDNIEESQHPKYAFLNAAGTAVVTNGYYNILTEGLENGVKTETTLTMNTGPLGVLKNTQFAVDTAYQLQATVADFDVDRTNDWRTASRTQDFTLYDNDVQEPIAATTYGGGPFGVEIGSTVVSGMGADYNHTNVLTDHVLAQQYGGGSTEVSFHLGFYDFSGWEATKIAVGGTSGTTIWENGVNKGGTGLTFVQTNGVANSPGAEMVWKMSMATLWDKYGGSKVGTSAATQEVWAAIHDLDDDRVNASGADIDSMSVKFTGGATWGKVGTFVLDDQDEKAPKWRTTNEAVRTLFVIATNVTTVEKLTNTENRVTRTACTTETNPATHTYKLYDSELRGSNGGGLKLAMTADVTDPTGGTTGKHNTGLKRGTTETESYSSVLSGDIDLYNTTLKLMDGDTVVTNAFTNFQPHADGTSWSTSDDSTKMSVNPTRTVWGWTNFTYKMVGDFLPSGSNSRTLTAQVEAYDADCDRAGDQMHATITGPTINLYDNDTVKPGDIDSAYLTVNGQTVPSGTIDEDTAPWTNKPVFTVRFKPVSDGAKGTNDKEVTGIGGYRAVATGTTTLSTFNGWTATKRAGYGTTWPVAASEGVLGDPGFEGFKSGTSPWTPNTGSYSGTYKSTAACVTEGAYAAYLAAGTNISQTIRLGGADWEGKSSLAFNLKLDSRAATSGSRGVKVTYDLYEGDPVGTPSSTTTQTIDFGSNANDVLMRTYSVNALPLGTQSNLVITLQPAGNYPIYLDNLVGTITGLTASDTVPMTFTATKQGLTTNFLYAVDRDNDRAGDTLAGKAAAFYIAYDCTKPTSLGNGGEWTTRTNKMAASSDNLAVADPTSEMYLDWTAANVTMSPDTNTTSHAAGSRLYSPWKSYKVYMTTYTPNSDTPSFSDSSVSGPVSTFDGLATEEERAASGWASITSDNGYSTLATSATKYFCASNLEPGENYIFAVVGLDAAGNESRYPVYAIGDTIKFMVTQSVIRAWTAVSNELNVTNFTPRGTKIFDPVHTEGTRGTPTLYWDAKINSQSGRANRGYSLVYRDGMGFDEGCDTLITNAAGTTGYGWGRIAGNSISNNYYAEPDGNALKLGRGRMRFYRATYAGREIKTDSITPLASEEVYALHNVKLSEGRNYVALHGVPYTNTFRGVFGTDTAIWPPETKIEFFGGLRGTDTVATKIYFFKVANGKGTWCEEGSMDDVTDWPGDAQPNFFTRGFAINLPTANAAAFYNGETITVYERENGKLTGKTARVFDWAPVLQMPTNGGFSVTVNCGTHTTFGKMVVPTGVDTFVAFRAPRILHPRELQLPLVSGTSATKTGFVYNTTNPLEGDRLLIRAAAAKTDRAMGDDSPYGNEAGSDSPTEMYYDGTNWRWNKGSVNANNPIVSDNVYPIKPNDAIIIRSLNGGVGNSWTWTYDPTTLYEAADRHFGE